MINQNAEVAIEREALPEANLWQAVIASTIKDWLTGPLRQKRQAEAYLFSDNTDFPVVCQSAGMDAQKLRAKLERLRSRHAKDSQLAA